MSFSQTFIQDVLGAAMLKMAKKLPLIGKINTDSGILASQFLNRLHSTHTKAPRGLDPKMVLDMQTSNMIKFENMLSPLRNRDHLKNMRDHQQLYWEGEKALKTLQSETQGIVERLGEKLPGSIKSHEFNLHEYLFPKTGSVNLRDALLAKLAKISKNPVSGAGGNPTATPSVGGIKNPYKNSPTVSAPNLASAATINTGMSQGIASMTPQANSTNMAMSSKAPLPPMPPQGAMKPGWQS